MLCCCFSGFQFLLVLTACHSYSIRKWTTLIFLHTATFLFVSAWIQPMFAQHGFLINPAIYFQVKAKDKFRFIPGFYSLGLEKAEVQKLLWMCAIVRINFVSLVHLGEGSSVWGEVGCISVSAVRGALIVAERDDYWVYCLSSACG